jgi:hypothetical protein
VVQNLFILNQAFLGKRLWHYAHEKEDIWKLVVDVNYESVVQVVL